MLNLFLEETTKQNFMKKILLSLFGTILLSTVGVAQKFEWNTGGTSGGSYHSSASCTSQSGNTLISGRYNSSMQIDTVSRTVPNYGQSYYICMLDSTGGAQYFRNSNTEVKTLALDDDNMYMGIGAYSIVLDGDSLKSDTVNARLLFAKFDAQMGMLWNKQIKPVNPSDQADMSCDAISIDPSGNVYVLCSSSSYLDIRLDTAQFNVNGRFLFKFDANGTMLFWRKLNFSGITLMTTDKQGNVWLSGKYNYNSYASNQQVDFGNSVIVTNSTLTNNHYDLFTARYNSSGIAQWARFTGGNYSTNNTYDIRGIIFDSNNNAIMQGSFWNKIIFFNDTLTGNTTDQYSQNQFIAKFSANGTYQWSKTIYDSLSLGTYINQITYGPEDRMYIMGEYNYKGFFLGDTTFVPIGSSGSSDRYLACFDSTFKCVWYRYLQNGVPNNVTPNLSVIDNGDIYLTSASSNFKYGGVEENYGYYWFAEDSLSAGETGGTPCVLKLSSDNSTIITGITHNPQNPNDLVVYPNPSTQAIYINKPDATNYQIEVDNANGQIVKKYNKYDPSTGIVLSDLSKGIYFIHLVNIQDNSIITRKIILQ